MLERDIGDAMRFRVVGADRKTGDECELVIEAADARSATRVANEKGILVSECRAASAKQRPSDEYELAPEPAPPHQPPLRFDAAPLVQQFGLGSFSISTDYSRLFELTKQSFQDCGARIRSRIAPVAR